MQDAAREVRTRPSGRLLKDCRKDGLTTPNGLWPAEEELLKAAAAGKPCIAGSRRPDAPADSNKIDPLFLRFLLLGGDEFAPVHEKGIDIQGAFITGDIDLKGCEITRPLRLFNCHVAGSLIGVNTQLSELDLQKSFLQSIDCSFSRFKGSVFLRDGFAAEGAVRFLGAEIGGQLACNGGKFENANGDALSCDTAKITGSVFLTGGFAAEGEVRFLGAEIGGVLNCEGGKFKNANGDALSCDRAKVTGGVFPAGRAGLRWGHDTKVIITQAKASRCTGELSIGGLA
jgi:hypothetical protein